MVLSELDQRVLDAICQRVEQRIGIGLVGWSIGYQDVVVQAVSRSLKARTVDVEQSIKRLVKGGLLCDSMVTDDEWEDKVVGKLSVRHNTWLAYSRFNERRLLDRWKFESLEEWYEWDGVDGSPQGGWGPEPFRRPLEIDIVQLPSRDFVILWKNKEVYSAAFNDEHWIPREVAKIADTSNGVAHFACRLVSFLANKTWFDLDYVESIVGTLREGWSKDGNRWSRMLGEYESLCADSDRRHKPSPERLLLNTLRHFET